MITRAPLAAFVISVVPTLAFAEPGPAASRSREAWEPIIQECRLPDGESADAVVGEAVSLLGSPRSELRDDVGYGVVASCVYAKRKLSAGQRAALVERLVANLRQGVGETGNASVLLRAFSALDLSLLAALEVEDPALESAAYRRLCDAAFAYLRDERDLRGLEPAVGWIHATAHTADLFKALARDPRFAKADHGRLLDAVFVKLTSPGTPAFTHGEEERLAAAVVSLVRRSDFDPAALDPWLERFGALEKRVWAVNPPDPSLLAVAQNARSFLFSLHVLLSLPLAAPTAPGEPAAPGSGRALEKLEAALAAMRRG